MLRRSFIKAITSAAAAIALPFKVKGTPESDVPTYKGVPIQYVDRLDSYPGVRIFRSDGIGSWNDPNNWVGGICPKEGDHVIIDRGSCVNGTPPRYLHTLELHYDAGVSFPEDPTITSFIRRS